MFKWKSISGSLDKTLQIGSNIFSSYLKEFGSSRTTPALIKNVVWLFLIQRFQIGLSIILYCLFLFFFSKLPLQTTTQYVTNCCMATALCECRSECAISKWAPIMLFHFFRFQSFGNRRDQRLVQSFSRCLLHKSSLGYACLKGYVLVLYTNRVKLLVKLFDLLIISDEFLHSALNLSCL